MATKKQTPLPPRGFEDIKAEMCRMADMSCKPTIPCPSIGAVIDEDQTVRWNRKEVERLRAEYNSKVKDLSTVKNQWRDRLEKELYERVVIELEGKVTTKGAARICAYAYEQGHAYGIHEVFNHLMELLELFINVLKED